MPYQPLHHKYRPQSFAELVGQEAIATTLTHAIQQQRIAPAYLFTGARGTGKTSSARILAKSLNCLSSQVPTEQPCGICEVCRTIANGSALDVIEIDAASNTGVDNIRELIERAQFAPVQCRYKVYVIDEVHMLSNAAFNALLKTLEEPPDRIVFVLATTDPQRILPTIISRCQRFDFRRIPLEAMVEHLSTIADKEAIVIANDATQLIAQISQGGLRDAESLLDQLSLLEGGITVERVWDLVGAVPERDLMSLLKAIVQDNPEVVLDQTRHLMDRGREPLIVLQNLAGFYRDLLIAKTAPTRNDLVALTPPTWAELCEFARSLETGVILVGQQHLRSSEVQIKNTTQPRLWLEVTLLGLLPSAIGGQAVSSQQSAVSSQQSAVSSQQSAVSSQQPVVREQGIGGRKQGATGSGQQVDEAIAPIKQTPIEHTPPDNPLPPPVQVVPPSVVPPSTEADVAAAIEAVAPEVEMADSPDVEGQSIISAVELVQTWQQVLTHLQPRGTQELLRQQCRLLAFDGQEARISISSQPLFKMAQLRLPNVEAAFLKVFNSKVRVSLEVASTTEPIAGTQLAAQPNDAPSPNQTRQAASTDASALHVPPVPPHTSSSVSPSTSHSDPSPQSESTTDSTETDLPQPAAWEEDEGTRAAKRLAEFFGGKVVNTDDDIDLISPLVPLADVDDLLEEPIAVWEGADPEADLDEDEDLPF